MNQNIKDIGNKLDLDAVDISKNLPKKRSKGVFWGIHALTLLLSGLLGFVFGEIHQYPYSYTVMESFPPFGLNLVNGVITLPPRKFNSKYRGITRAVVLGVNVVLAVFIYFVVFESQIDYSNSCSMGVCVAYGVYTDTDEQTNLGT